MRLKDTVTFFGTTIALIMLSMISVHLFEIHSGATGGLVAAGALVFWGIMMKDAKRFPYAIRISARGLYSGGLGAGFIMSFLHTIR